MRWTNLLAWALAIAAAAIFLIAGFKKLSGDPHMVEVFAKVGIGQWSRYLTGALEIGGGLALLWPRTSAVSALMLACVMVGATVSHLTVLATPPTLALALLAACLGIASLRRDMVPGLARA